MTTWRLASIVAAAALLLAWLSSGSPGCAIPADPQTGGRRTPGVAATGTPVVDLEVRDPARRPQALSGATGRDLFRERDAGPLRPASPVLPSSAPRPEPALAEPLVPAPPRLVLSGIAEDDEGSGVPARVAVISGAGDVWLVRAGGVVAGRYRVERVDADAVHLLDLRDGPRLVLRFR